mmetsp:Transcript_39776/g.67807  ORF Transcript_39776/g.67807 Transcript_39776/m.67807 type:complete len:83 (+) Transcript_39776:100-348(+)
MCARPMDTNRKSNKDNGAKMTPVDIEILVPADRTHIGGDNACGDGVRSVRIVVKRHDRFLLVPCGVTDAFCHTSNDDIRWRA